MNELKMSDVCACVILGKNTRVLQSLVFNVCVCAFDRHSSILNEVQCPSNVASS